MLKPILSTILWFLCLQMAGAQIRHINWIKTKTTYKDNTDLDDLNLIKYKYLRYDLKEQGKLSISNDYSTKGLSCGYTIVNNHLQLRSELGYVMNEFLIEKADQSTLVLLQKGINGFNGDDCVRFYFIPEAEFQKDYSPRPANLLAGQNADTVYLANSRLYPTYKGKEDYFEVLKAGVGDQGSRDLYFLATFIVRKDGHADSLKILESFSPAFDKKIIKNFNKTSNNWTPATINGKPVSVLMKQEYQYHSSSTALPVFGYENQVNKLLAVKDYESALFYLDRGLELISNDKQMLYKRAVCKHELGNMEEALLDLKELERLGDESAAELRKQWLSVR